MTQQEFFQRTGVQVSSDEFWAINEQYNESNLNKDEYCKLWKKVNPKRVKEAQSAQKKAEDADFLYCILMFNICIEWYYRTEDPIWKYTNAAERRRLESLGVETKDILDRPRTVYQVRMSIKSKLDEMKEAA